MESNFPPPVKALFDNYERERLTFVKSAIFVADKPQNRDGLKEAGIVELVRPLLLDEDVAVRSGAALILWMVLGAPPATNEVTEEEESDITAIHSLLERYATARREFAQQLFRISGGETHNFVPILRLFVGPLIIPLLKDPDESIRSTIARAVELLDGAGSYGRMLDGPMTVSGESASYGVAYVLETCIQDY